MVQTNERTDGTWQTYRNPRNDKQVSTRDALYGGSGILTDEQRRPESAGDILTVIGADAPVESEPLFDRFGNECRTHVCNVATDRPTKDPKRVVRADDGRMVWPPEPSRILGVVGAGYQLVPFERVAKTALEYIRECGGLLGAGGVMANGAQMWLCVELPEEGDIAGDAVGRFVYLRSSHDGSSGVQRVCSPTMLACTNQLAGIFSRGADVSLGHTTNVGRRVDALRAAVGADVQYFERHEGIGRGLSAVSLDRAFVQAYATALWPAPSNPAEHSRAATGRARRRDRIVDLWEGEQLGYGARDALHGTAWGLANAVTQACQHESNIRGGADGRMRSVQFGSAAIESEQSLQLLCRASGVDPMTGDIGAGLSVDALLSAVDVTGSQGLSGDEHAAQVQRCLDGVSL